MVSFSLDDVCTLLCDSSIPDNLNYIRLQRERYIQQFFPVTYYYDLPHPVWAPLKLNWLILLNCLVETVTSGFFFEVFPVLWQNFTNTERNCTPLVNQNKPQA